MLFLIDINAELRKVAGSICNAIYSLISILFDVFYSLAKLRIFSPIDANGVPQVTPITVIYKRVTLLLGIIMVFYVTFQFVKYVLEPDTFADKEKGGEKLIFKLIIVVVLMGTIPTIFDKVYYIQDLILDSHLIDKVLIGNANSNMGSFGRNMSANVFKLFYYIDDDFVNAEFQCDGGLKCSYIVDKNLSSLANYGSMPIITTGLSTKVESTYAIHFDTWFAMGVGLFLCYILVLYVIDVGVRVAQLTYLQIIAPIPIISYLSPKKDGMFQKWVKQCVVTFLDLFIRLFIIYFMLLVISNIDIKTIAESIDASVDETTKTWVYIALILGLLLFAQKAPKLIQELFPNMGAAMGNFGLKPGDRMPALAAKAAAMGLGMGVGASKLIGKAINTRRRNKTAKEEAGIDKVKSRRKALREAKKDGNRAKIDEARKALSEEKEKYKNNYRGSRKDTKKAKNDYERKSKEYRGMVKNEGESDAAFNERKKAKLDEVTKAKKKYEDEKTKLYRRERGGVAGAIALGAVTGAVTGIRQGAKAKDLKSIGSSVVSTAKAVSAQNKAHADWKQEGGTTGFARFKEGIKSTFGIESSAESLKREQDAIERSIKSSEEEIKAQEEELKGKERLANAAGESAKVISSAKSTAKECGLGNKIKVSVGTEVMGFEGDPNMTAADYCDKPNPTIGDVVSIARAKKESASSKLAEAQKRQPPDPEEIKIAEQKFAEADKQLSYIENKWVSNTANSMLFEAIKNNADRSTLNKDYDIATVDALYASQTEIESIGTSNPELIREMLSSVENRADIPGADIPEVKKIKEDGRIFQQNEDGTYRVDLQSYTDIEDVRKAMEAYSTWKKNQLTPDRIKLGVAKDSVQSERNAFAQMSAAQGTSEKSNAGHPINSSYFNGSSGK